jgi:hypothetical protein
MNRVLTLTTLLIVSGAIAGEVYYLKAKETLSGVLFSRGYSPIYGKRGALRELIELNPKLKESRGNKVRPGMKIILPPQKISTTPTITPTVTKETEEIKTSSFFKNLSWGLELSLLSVHLRSKEASGTESKLSSKVAFGQSLQIGKKFSENLQGFVQFNQLAVEFLKPETQTTVLKNEKANLLNFTVGIDYRLFSRLHVNTFYSLAESAFLASQDGFNFEIDEFRTHRIGAGANWSMVQGRSWDVYAKASAAYVFPATEGNLSSQESFGFQSGLGYKKNFSHSSLWVEGIYRTIDLNTTRANFIQTDTGILVGFNFHFDD